MAHRLAPCPVCARHVRLAENTCPFCGGSMPARVAVPAPPTRRPTSLTRTLVVLGALAAGAAACGDDAPASGSDTGGEQPPGGGDDGTATPGDDGSDGDDGATSAAECGAPAVPDDGPDDDGAAVAEYGAPAPPEE